MPIEKIKQSLYVFIKDRQHSPYPITLDTLRRWATVHKVKKSDMGYALQLLKREELVVFKPKYGWLAR